MNGETDYQCHVEIRWIIKQLNSHCNCFSPTFNVVYIYLMKKWMSKTNLHSCRKCICSLWDRIGLQNVVWNKLLKIKYPEDLFFIDFTSILVTDLSVCLVEWLGSSQPSLAVAVAVCSTQCLIIQIAYQHGQSW